MNAQSSIQEQLKKPEKHLIDVFIDDCKLRNLSLETIRSYRSTLKIIIAFINRVGLSIERLDKRSLIELLRYFKDERKVSYKTIDNYFFALSSFFSFLNYIEEVEGNPVIPFRERYMTQYKNPKRSTEPKRKLISVEEMSVLINSILDPRDKAMITLLAKTGIRRGELIDIDLDDINWAEQCIKLKQKRKRSNLTVFFDDETAYVLQRWLRTRGNYRIEDGCKALFVGEHGGRLKRHGICHAVTKHTLKVGLHDPSSPRMKDHFTPHCLRHWFTTHLRRNEISREFLKELRGDSRREAVDIYDHIDKNELKRAYLAAIPTLGIR